MITTPNSGEVQRTFYPSSCAEAYENASQENPRHKLPRSVSSIQWGAQHYIDEDRHLLVLRITRCTGVDLCLEEPPEVAIHLADGTLFRPARDLLPQLEPTVSVHPGTTPSGQDWQVAPDDPF